MVWSMTNHLATIDIWRLLILVYLWQTITQYLTLSSNIRWQTRVFFETIKYFKNSNKDKKFIMIIFPGNDFLNYKTNQKNQNRYWKKWEEKTFHIKVWFKIHFFIDYNIWTSIRKIKYSDKRPQDPNNK